MSEWREVRISELSTIDIGGTPSRAIPAFWAEKPAGHPWISIADLKGKYVFETKEHITSMGVRSSNVKLIPEHTTVMSFKLTVGRTAITSGEMFCNEAIAIFQPKDDRLNGQWLYHALPRAATSVVTDTAVKGATLNKTKMAEMTVNLPPPGEQVRIAQVLDTLDTAIHETEAIIAKLKAVKQGLLHDLLTRGIAANGELRPPQPEAPHLYKESPLGWIPKEWEVKPLYEVGEAVTGTTPPSVDPLAWGSGTPFITPSEIADDRPIADSERQVSARGLRYVRLLPAKTIVVVCIGSTIGKVGITATASCTNQQINAVLPYEGIHPEYLFLAIRMHIGQLRGLAGLQAVPIVNKTSFESIYVPVARPPEQIEIAKRLDAISTRIFDEDTTLHKLRLGKAGLLDDLLTGRVRVTPLLAEAAQQPGSA